MGRLIDVDARIEEVKRDPMNPKMKDFVLDILRRAPTVSAVEVCRCRECKWHEDCKMEIGFILNAVPKKQRFCGLGKRKPGGHPAGQNAPSNAGKAHDNADGEAGGRKDGES